MENKIHKKHFLILLGISLVIPIFMLIIKRFPSTDFWWYHAQNWYLLNYLSPLGKIIGWNPFWHLGHSFLQMYAPGGYVFVLLLTKLFSLSLISAELLTVSLAYILLIISFFIFLAKYTNIKLAFVSALLLIVFPRLFNELFIQGHYYNFLALSFGLIGLSFLKSESIKGKIVFLLFMSLCLITHHTFFIILFVTTFLTTIFTQRDLKIILKTLFKMSLPILLISFWLIPAIIESKYWGVGTTSYNSLILYLLSYGPFLMICFIGVGFLLKNKNFRWIGFFISSLFFLSIASVYIFPYLPSFISGLLNKIFIATFKLTVVSSIFLIVGLAYVIIKCMKYKKWRYFGVAILVGYALFSFFSINLYIKQDATGLLFNGDDAFKKDSYNELYLKNFDNLQDLIEINSLDNRYFIDPMVGIRLFKTPSVQGIVSPRPRRDLLLDKNTEDEFFKFSGNKLFVTSKEPDKDGFLIGNYTVKYFDLNLGLLKDIKNRGFLNYLRHPEEFHSKIENKELYAYKVKEPERIIETSKFKPIAYIAKEELGDKSLIEEEKYRIPIAHFKKDKDIDPYFVKVFDEEEIEFLPLELDSQVKSKIEINKITISTKKIEEYTPIYIKINYSPHWKAYIEKEELQVYNIFPDFMLVLVPPNTEKVELIWENTFYDLIGLIMSGIGVIILIIFLIKGNKSCITDKK